MLMNHSTAGVDKRKKSYWLIKETVKLERLKWSEKKPRKAALHSKTLAALSSVEIWHYSSSTPNNGLLVCRTFRHKCFLLSSSEVPRISWIRPTPMDPSLVIALLPVNLPNLISIFVLNTDHRNRGIPAVPGRARDGLSRGGHLHAAPARGAAPAGANGWRPLGDEPQARRHARRPGRLGAASAKDSAFSDGDQEQEQEQQQQLRGEGERRPGGAHCRHEGAAEEALLRRGVNHSVPISIPQSVPFPCSQRRKPQKRTQFSCDSYHRRFSLCLCILSSTCDFFRTLSGCPFLIENISRFDLQMKVCVCVCDWQVHAPRPKTNHRLSVTCQTRNRFEKLPPNHLASSSKVPEIFQSDYNLNLLGKFLIDLLPCTSHSLCLCVCSHFSLPATVFVGSDGDLLFSANTQLVDSRFCVSLCLCALSNCFGWLCVCDLMMMIIISSGGGGNLHLIPLSANDDDDGLLLFHVLFFPVFCPIKLLLFLLLLLMTKIWSIFQLAHRITQCVHVCFCFQIVCVCFWEHLPSYRVPALLNLRVKRQISAAFHCFFWRVKITRVVFSLPLHCTFSLASKF